MNMRGYKAEPDFSNIEKVLKLDKPERVPFFELYSDIEAEVLAHLDIDVNGKSPLEKHLEYQLRMGYDYINVKSPDFKFLTNTEQSEDDRAYYQGKSHVMANRQDYEKYPWPDAAKCNYEPYEEAKKILPSGMRIMTLGPGGVLENVMWMLGYEGMSYMLCEDPELLKEIFDQVGSRLEKYFGFVASIDEVDGMTFGDDMGYKTQTMFSPDTLREYVFPWHKRIADAVHAQGKPVVLHSCGNLEAVREDIIACGWNGIHSFEDQIYPVWESIPEYGNRIAHLGGFDVDKAARLDEQAVREHTNMLYEKCSPNGGWAFGTGNSVPDYIPVVNFVAMMEEAMKLRG